MSISLKPAVLVPRPKRGRKVLYVEEAQFLREHSGEWFELRTMPSSYFAASLAGNIRNGLLRSFTPAHEFEAWGQDDVVIARHVGPE